MRQSSPPGNDISSDPLAAALLKEVQRAQRGEAPRLDAVEAMLSQNKEESHFKQLLRSKKFWFGVFGTMLFIYFAVLIKLVLDDI